MAEGYIYVLQNRLFGSNVVKIGFTKRTPDVRAREIYVGATGVPLPFEIAVAYSVVDCVRAEKLVHRALRAYRLNNRREFFRITPSVGASVVLDICEQVNAAAGASPPTRFDFPSLDSPTERQIAILVDDKLVDDEYDRAYDAGRVFSVELDRAISSPVGTSSLTEQQLFRARVLHHVLAKLSPMPWGKWVEGFTRDRPPERELLIWEHIAKAYMTLEHADEAPSGLRSEALELLLLRSSAPTNDVLAEMRVKLKHFSHATAKRLLDAYGLKPKPVVFRWRSLEAGDKAI